MITFSKGDILDTEADVRVNTVNCVGVMGAGIALAFKTRFPAMFKEYEKACRRGEVQPGRLHIWRSLGSEEVINFPTKRHWKEPSRYEDIEAGLIALRIHLETMSHVKVALPALGCGLGGLDWTRVSQMIQQHLAGLEADIVVFEPAASRQAGEDARRASKQDYQDYTKELHAQQVSVLVPEEPMYPNALRGTSAAKIYVKGNFSLLNCPIIALLPSALPQSKEVKAVEKCIAEMAKPGLTFFLGYRAEVERRGIHIALEKGANVVIGLAEGILRFEIYRDLEDVWNERRIAVFTTAEPNSKWASANASRLKDLALSLSRACLISDPTPVWLPRFLQASRHRPTVSLFYVKYGTQDETISRILQEANVRPVGMKEGVPNVIPLLKCVQIAGDKR